MATITQAIASLERQLRELADESSKQVLKQVYACLVDYSDMKTPCAVIEAVTSTRVRVTIYHFAPVSQHEGEKTIIELASICSARWSIQGRFSWISHLGCLQRTFQFELAYE